MCVISSFSIATSLCNSPSIQNTWHVQIAEQSFCFWFPILSTVPFFFFSVWQIMHIHNINIWIVNHWSIEDFGTLWQSCIICFLTKGNPCIFIKQLHQLYSISRQNTPNSKFYIATYKFSIIQPAVSCKYLWCYNTCKSVREIQSDTGDKKISVMSLAVCSQIWLPSLPNIPFDGLVIQSKILLCL